VSFSGLIFSRSLSMLSGAAASTADETRGTSRPVIIRSIAALMILFLVTVVDPADDLPVVREPV